MFLLQKNQLLDRMSQESDPGVSSTSYDTSCIMIDKERERGETGILMRMTSRGRAPENVHRFATATAARLLLLLLFRRLPLLRLLTTLSVLLTTTLLLAPLRCRSRNSCEVYGGNRFDWTHRGSWQSTSRESPIHLPWQVELVDRPRRLSLPAISVDSFHLPMPTCLSKLSLPGCSTQIREPAVILIAHRFCLWSTACNFNYTLDITSYFYLFEPLTYLPSLIPNT